MLLARTSTRSPRMVQAAIMARYATLSTTTNLPWSLVVGMMRARETWCVPSPPRQTTTWSTTCTTTTLATESRGTRVNGKTARVKGCCRLRDSRSSPTCAVIRARNHFTVRGQNAIGPLPAATHWQSICGRRTAQRGRSSSMSPRGGLVSCRHTPGHL